MHLTRKQIFIAKLCLCSFGAHLFLLLCFFLSRGDRFTQHINFSLPADVKFIYMPFQKRVGLQAQTGAESGQAASTNANALTSQQAQELAQKKTKTVMTRPGKKKGRKKAKKPQMKAPEPKPKKQTPLPVPESRPSTDNSTPTVSEPIAIGQQELDALEVAESIREEVVRVWHPPIGLASGKQCTMRIVVDWQGNVQEMAIEESSQVPAFDASVKLALQSMQFPKSVFGKEIILPFGG